MNHKLGNINIRSSTTKQREQSCRYPSFYTDQHLLTKPTQGVIPHELNQKNEIWPKSLLLSFKGKITRKKKKKTTKETARETQVTIRSNFCRDQLSSETRNRHCKCNNREESFTHRFSQSQLHPGRRVSSASGSRILNIEHHEVSFAITQVNSSTEPRYSQDTNPNDQVLNPSLDVLQ